MTKKMKLRRDDCCAACGEEQPAGTTAIWCSDERVVRCLSCHDGEAHQIASEPLPLVTSAPTAMAGPPRAPSVETMHASMDVAGGSAQTEYEKRARRERSKKEQRVTDDVEWREDLRERRPVLGRIATALTPKPQIGPESQPTQAWKIGAEGEQRVAEVLAEAVGIEVLHDRLMPRSRSANIDHIVVGPSGVFIIDAKKYKGKIETRDVGGWLKTDVRLYVNSRDRTKLVDGVLRQVEAVRRVLDDSFPHIPIHGVLCFVGCDWGWIMRPKHVKEVTAIWPMALAEHVSVEGDFAERVPEIAEFLRQSLRPAS